MERCQNGASYRYTWPGRNESFICNDHAPKLRAVSNAMGLPLQMIPLLHEDEQCDQKVSP